MSAYLVIPPKKVHEGVFIVSFVGCRSTFSGQGRKFELVNITESMTRSGNRVHHIHFESGKDCFECCRLFKMIKGAPAVKKNRKLIKAPKALWPFAHPRTKVQLN